MAGSISKKCIENCGNLLMHVCASAPTAVRKIHVNAISMTLQLAAVSSKALKEGHVKEFKLEKTITNSLSWVIGEPRKRSRFCRLFSRACAMEVCTSLAERILFQHQGRA